MATKYTEPFFTKMKLTVSFLTYAVSRTQGTFFCLELKEEELLKEK